MVLLSWYLVGFGQTVVIRLWIMYYFIFFIQIFVWVFFIDRTCCYLGYFYCCYFWYSFYFSCLRIIFLLVIVFYFLNITQLFWLLKKIINYVHYLSYKKLYLDLLTWVLTFRPTLIQSFLTLSSKSPLNLLAMMLSSFKKILSTK